MWKLKLIEQVNGLGEVSFIAQWYLWGFIPWSHMREPYHRSSISLREPTKERLMAKVTKILQDQEEKKQRRHREKMKNRVITHIKHDVDVAGVVSLSEPTTKGELSIND